MAETIRKAKKEKNIHPETSVLCRTDLIYFSAISWIDYVSMTLPVITNPYGSGNTVSLLDGENMFLKVIDVEYPCI